MENAEPKSYPDKNTFLEVLFLHRERLSGDLNRAGWSKWGLIAAIASLVWISIEVYSSEPQIYLEAFLLVLCLIMVEGLIHSLGFFNSSRSTKYARKYRSINDELQSSFWSSAYDIATYTFFIQLLNNLDETPSYITLFPKIYCWASLIANALALALRGIAFYLPENFNSSKVLKTGINWILIVTVIWSVVSIFCVFNIIGDIQNLGFIKWGVIILALYKAIDWLIDEFQPNLLLDSIDELIDDVTLDQISIEDAEKKFKILLLGRDFPDIGREKMQQYLHHARSIHSLHIQFDGRYVEWKEAPEIDKPKKREQAINDYDKIKLKFSELAKIERRLIFIVLNFLPFEYDSPEHEEVMDFITKSKRVRNEILVSIETKRLILK